MPFYVLLMLFCSSNKPDSPYKLQKMRTLLKQKDTQIEDLKEGVKKADDPFRPDQVKKQAKSTV